MHESLDTIVTQAMSKKPKHYCIAPFISLLVLIVFEKTPSFLAPFCNGITGVIFSMAGFLVISAQVLIVLITGLVVLPPSSFTLLPGDAGDGGRVSFDEDSCVPSTNGNWVTLGEIGLSGETLRIDFPESIDPPDAAVVFENAESTELVIVLFPLGDSLP
jgi:hypothetical protein